MTRRRMLAGRRPRREASIQRGPLHLVRADAPVAPAPALFESTDVVRRRLFAGAWQAALLRMGVPSAPAEVPSCVTLPPLASVLWLPDARQLLIVSPAHDAALREDLESLYRRLPAREFTDECRPDLRVLAGMRDGQFVGFDGTYWLHDVALMRCCHCGRTYVADLNAGWGCQASGCAYGGNADVEELAIGRMPREVWQRPLGVAS